MKLSVIIPVYNEEKTIEELLRKVDAVKIPGVEKEVILVDDCSKDGTQGVLKKLESRYKIIYHEANKGKGSAVRSGLAASTGDVIIIQDADLEYDPNDYGKLLKPIIDGETEVVYGSRFMSPKGKLKENDHFTYILHSVGNNILTALTNVLYGASLTDMETCYKVFTRKVLEDIQPLKAKRFDLEPELTGKILKKKHKIKEVPVNYYSRDYHEGKKITWKDGIKASYYIIKYRITN